MIFAITTLISALSISLIAAYFSIIGLATIFPGSIYAVIAMGSVLEIGKIIASIWLHKNWKVAPKMIKIYLFFAILVLMGITSMGIFGFLSKSHIEHEQNAEKSKALVVQVENKIERKKDYIDRQKELIKQNEENSENLGDKSSKNIKLEQEKIQQLTIQLDRDIEIDNKIISSLKERLAILDEDLNQIKNKSGGLFSSKKKDIEAKILDQKDERQSISEKMQEAESRISKHRDETSNLVSEIRKRIQEYQSIGFEKPENVENKIEELNANISHALDKIDELEKEKFNLDDGSRQLEAEVGPIKYVAELIADFTGLDFDIGKAVRIVIVILIFVFDPLAVLLVLAAHISLSKKFPKMAMDESLYLEKINEIELKHKNLEDKEFELNERKKDLEEEHKIVELHENQIEKYKQEISKNKESARKLKLEVEKSIINQEETAGISKDIETLSEEKQDLETQIIQLKEDKKQLFKNAEEVQKSAREIKSVLGKHEENKKEIQSIKIECNSIENNFEGLKEQIQNLSQENQMLKINKSQNKTLENQVNELKNQKNKLLEESLKKSAGSIIFMNDIGGGRFMLRIKSSIGGYHQFSKLEPFSDDQIKNMQGIVKEIEAINIQPDSFSASFEKAMSSRIDIRTSNRELKKIKPEYSFQK